MVIKFNLGRDLIVIKKVNYGLKCKSSMSKL
jgi:hypothetical protein